MIFFKPAASKKCSRIEFIKSFCIEDCSSLLMVGEYPQVFAMELSSACFDRARLQDEPEPEKEQGRSGLWNLRGGSMKMEAIVFSNLVTEVTSHHF